MKNGLAGEIANKYWRSGVVGGLIVLDCLALGVCMVDIFRFLNAGHSFASALRVAAEKLREGAEIPVTLGVLMFFVVALPMVFVLVGSVAGLRERCPWLLGKRGREVLALHLLLSFMIAGFTSAAIAMEVLAGYENNDAVKYSFVSAWLGLVFLGQPLWVSYISPIIRKFFIRLPHEKESVRKVATEVITEEPFGGERVA